MSKRRLNKMDDELNGYIKVQVNDLESDALSSDDELAVQNLAKRLRGGNIFLLVFILILVGNFVSIFSVFFKTGLAFTVEMALFTFLLVGFVGFILFHIYRNLRNLRDGSFKKAKYGVVEKKFYEIDAVDEGTTKNYYINVVFPNTNQHLVRVNCEKKTYQSIMKGDRVLVASFDNKTAHAISLNE